MVSGGCDNEGVVWKVDNERISKVQQLKGHAGWVHGVIVMGDIAITCSYDRCIKLWDIRRRRSVSTLETASRGVYGMSVVGNILYSAQGSALSTWDLRSLASGVDTTLVTGTSPVVQSLSGNVSGVYGHCAAGDRLYAIAPDSSIRCGVSRAPSV